MKVWFVVCSILSGALLAVTLSSIRSCTEKYEIDSLGRLLRIQKDESRTPPLETTSLSSWDQALWRFEFVKAHVIPGDTLVQTETRTMIPYLDVRMWKLELSRQGRSYAVYRQDHVLFWSVLMLLSLAPLVLWSIAAIIAVCLSPPGNRSRPVESPR